MSNPRGNIKHGGHGTLTYARWKSMIQRCCQPSAANFKYYGAKGVVVCDRWRDFAQFRNDMGDCPGREYTLDRIDNANGYEPGNCRWATKTDQNRNRSHCVELTHQGRTMILRDWAAEIGITPNALAQRLYLGWSVERALTTPLKRTSSKRQPTAISACCARQHTVTKTYRRTACATT